MSLDNIFDLLLAKDIATNEDQDLFKQYLNLDEYNYNYGDLQPTQQPLSVIPSPVLTPPVVHSTPSSSEVYPAASHPGESVATPWMPIAPSTTLATPFTNPLSVSHHPPVRNGTDNTRVVHPAWSLRLDSSAPLATTHTHPACRAPRPTGLGATSTYWNTRATTYGAGFGTVGPSAPCSSGHACMAVSPSVPHVGATPAGAHHTTEKLETPFDTTATQQDGHDSSALVAQLQREAEDFLAQFASLFKNSDSGTSPAVANPLQPQNSIASPTSLVKRTTKAEGRNVTSLPYPSAHARTRVPGRYLCSWEGCNESFARKERLERHVTSKHMRSKDHHCTYCEYACSRKDNLRAHMRNCKSRPEEL